VQLNWRRTKNFKYVNINPENKGMGKKLNKKNKGTPP